MKTKAAIAYAAGKPLEIAMVDLDGPRAGEVLVEIKATGICHTDEFTRTGADPEGLFPVIFGHEGAGIIVDVGPGVTSVKQGDHVIPLYTPECRQCKSCTSQKTNLCTAIRATQGKGVMPDGTSRFSIGKEMIHLGDRPTLADLVGPFGNPSSDSDRTKVTLDTRSLLFVLFEPREEPDASVNEHLLLSKGILSRHVGGHSTKATTIHLK